MKFCQLCVVNRELPTTGGLFKYYLGLHKALNENGHQSELILLDFNKPKDEVFTDELKAKVNSCDWCFLNEIPNKKSPEEFSEAFVKFIMEDVQAKKAIFLLAHTKSTLTSNHRFVLKYPGFLASIDKYCSFQRDNAALLYIEDVVGKEVAQQKFLELNLLCYFDEENKKKWIDVSNKKKSFAYFGRYANFKDPIRFLRAAPMFLENGFDCNIYGIDQTPSIMMVQDLKYHYDENGNRSRSQLVHWVRRKDLKDFEKPGQQYFEVDFPRDKKIYSYGPYKNEIGQEIMRKTAFGCDFFNTTTNAYGTSLEYAIYELANNGCVPILAAELGKTVHFYDRNGVLSKNTIMEDGVGIFLEKDLSNIDSVIEQMDALYCDPKKYDDFRHYVFDKMRDDSDPKMCVEKLIEDISKSQV